MGDFSSHIVSNSYPHGDPGSDRSGESEIDGECGGVTSWRTAPGRRATLPPGGGALGARGVRYSAGSGARRNSTRMTLPGL